MRFLVIIMQNGAPIFFETPLFCIATVDKTAAGLAEMSEIAAGLEVMVKTAVGLAAMGANAIDMYHRLDAELIFQLFLPLLLCTR